MVVVGERVKVIFDDGKGVVPKEGVITAIDDFSITLDNKDILPKQRIIRMEFL